MTVDHWHECYVPYHILYPALNSPLWRHVFELILVVGLLGNLVNIAAFMHERMRSYTNLLFYWLAVCNFFVLVTMALICFGCGTKLATTSTASFLFPMLRTTDHKGGKYVLRGLKFDYFLFTFCMSYILISLHTVTVLLNIALSVSVHAAITSHLRFRAWCSDRTVRRTVVSATVFSFALWTPLLFLFPLRLDEEDWVSGRYTHTTPPPSHKWIQFVCSELGSILPLFALVMACSTLIDGIVKTRQGYRMLNAMLVADIDGGGSVDLFTKQMATMALPIAQICIFSLAEISISLVPASFTYSVLGAFSIHNDRFSGAHSCYLTTHLFLNGLVSFTFLLSSSCITFCYLASAHYRGTLGVIARSGYGRVKRMLKL